MTFDPRAHIVPFEEGEAWSDWVDELMEQFAASPEADTLPSERKATWAGLVLEYATGYYEESLATLTPHVVREVLLDTFPRKVSVDPAEGGNIVREMRAFFAFAGRAFKLTNMPDCAEALVPGLEARVEAALADTSKFGMAKSFVMGGRAAGFDMTSPDDLNAWMLLHTAGLVDSLGENVGNGFSRRPTGLGKSKAKRKAARKQQKKSQRKNR